MGGGVESNTQWVMHTQISIVLSTVGYEFVKFPFLQVMEYEKFHLMESRGLDLKVLLPLYIKLNNVLS